MVRRGRRSRRRECLVGWLVDAGGGWLVSYILILQGMDVVGGMVSYTTLLATSIDE